MGVHMKTLKWKPKDLTRIINRMHLLLDTLQKRRINTNRENQIKTVFLKTIIAEKTQITLIKRTSYLRDRLDATCAWYVEYKKNEIFKCEQSCLCLSIHLQLFTPAMMAVLSPHLSFCILFAPCSSSWPLKVLDLWSDPARVMPADILALTHWAI